MIIKPEIAVLRAELLKQWIDKNKEYLSHALITDRLELKIFMKGASIKTEITQFASDD